MMDNLEALMALAECGTMSRAALRLSITQSAVSKRIANLQSQLGKRLVERSGPAGRVDAVRPAHPATHPGRC